MDIFDTRVMLRSIELMKKPRTFLLTKFFPNEETSETEYVEVDIFKGKRRMAPFQRPIDAGKVVDRLGFTNRVIKLPYVKPKMKTTAGDLLKKQPGETVYDPKTPADRAREQLAKDMTELMDQIIRREEWMAAQALVTGKVEISGENINAEIDFLRNAGHNIVLATGNTWHEADEPEIDTDLVAWRSLIAQATGLTATDAVLGSNVVARLTHDPGIKSLLDNRRTDAGLLKLDQAPIEGVVLLGNIQGINLWSYEEWYVDDAGNEQPMIPPNRVVLGVSSPAARSTRHYGAIQDVESGSARVRMFPKSWVEKDPSARWLQVQSAPLPATHTPDAFVSVDVLTNPAA